MGEKLEVAGVGGKACVGPMQDCSACKCCNVTGYKCYLSSTKGPVCLDSIAVGASSSPKAVIKMDLEERGAICGVDLRRSHGCLALVPQHAKLCGHPLKTVPAYLKCLSDAQQ